MMVSEMPESRGCMVRRCRIEPDMPKGKKKANVVMTNGILPYSQIGAYIVDRKASAITGRRKIQRHTV